MVTTLLTYGGSSSRNLAGTNIEQIVILTGENNYTMCFSLLQAGEQIHVSLPLSQQVANESRLSMSESVSEFFDAQEVLLSASSSENEVRFLDVSTPTATDHEFGLKKVRWWNFVFKPHSKMSKQQQRQKSRFILTFRVQFIFQRKQIVDNRILYRRRLIKYGKNKRIRKLPFSFVHTHTHTSLSGT